MNSIPVFSTIFGKVFRKIFDADVQFGNLETEDGFNLLQEDGGLILLEDE